MRIRLILTQCLIATALVCAGCSSAPDDSEKNSQVPVNAEQAAPRKSATASATPRPAATEGSRADTSAAQPPVVFIIKGGDTNTTYAGLKDEIQSLADKYRGKVDFKNLDLKKRDPTSEFSQDPRYKEIKDFYDHSNAHSGSAAIFKPGESKPIVIPSESQGAPVDAAKYKEDLDDNLSRILATCCGSPTPTPNKRTPPERIEELERNVQALQKDVQALRDNGQNSGWLGYGILAALGLFALLLGTVSLLMARHGLRAEEEVGVLGRDFQMTRGDFDDLRAGVSSDVRDLKTKVASLWEVTFGKDGAGAGPHWNDFQALQDRIGRCEETFASRLGSLKARLDQGESAAAQLRQSLFQMVSWIGGVQEKGVASNGRSGSERERAELTARLEGYAEPLRALADQIKPLTTVMAGLAQNPAVADSPALHARVQKLYEEIRRFEAADEGLPRRLQSLRNGSYDERRARFDSERSVLHQRFDSMPPAEFINEYRRLFERHFPPGQEDGAAESQVGADEIGKLITGAQDYLMDWYSNYVQLMSQAQAAPQVTRGVTDELARVHAVAREVLRGFDILPVEIQLGQTAYDHRVHDTAMIKATTEYPANTVIEVQRAGFRRASTGEVLRRPQVIISGAINTI